MNNEYTVSDVVEIGTAEDLILGKDDGGSDDNAHFPLEANEFEG